MNWTEIAGFTSGALCVWLVVRQNIWNFPVGIANNLFFLWLFWSGGLYADSCLQIVYVVLAFVGWYSWLWGGKEHTGVTVVATTPLTIGACVIAVGSIAGALQWGLVRYTDSTVAGWDAVTTALSLTAQFMLSRNWIENWWFWIAADLIYIPLYAYKSLWLTSLLYALFLCLCVAGLLQWRAAKLPQPNLAR